MPKLWLWLAGDTWNRVLLLLCLAQLGGLPARVTAGLRKGKSESQPCQTFPLISARRHINTWIKNMTFALSGLLRLTSRFGPRDASEEGLVHQAPNLAELSIYDHIRQPRE